MLLWFKMNATKKFKIQRVDTPVFISLNQGDLLLSCMHTKPV